MSLTKYAAIALAREIKAEDPDLQVRPIPTPDGWLLVVHCGLFQFTVRSQAELASALAMIFGQPSPETLIEAFEPQIRHMAAGKRLREGMGIDDIVQLTATKAISVGVTTKAELLELAGKTIELAM